MQIVTHNNLAAITEINELKKKCNAQLILLKRNEQEVNVLKEKLKLKEQEIASLKETQKNTSVSEEMQNLPENEILRVVADFLKITKLLVEKKEMLENTYRTQTTLMYMRVKQDVFDKYIEDFSPIEKQRFLSLCAAFGIIRSNLAGNYLYKSTGLKVYYILNTAIAAVRQPMDSED